MESKKAHGLINRLIEPDRLRHLVHQANAARSDRTYPRRDFVDRARATQHRATIVKDTPVLVREPPLDLTFEKAELPS